jgi:hypothetical protein
MKQFIHLGAIAAALLGLAVLGTSCGKDDPAPTDKTVAVTAINVSQPSLDLVAGGTATISWTVLPSDATDKSVTLTSSNPGVATVDNSGKVTAVAPGSAVITLAATNGVKATVNVTVSAATVNVAEVTLDKTELSLEEGEEATLTATVKPDDATDKSVAWKSSDEAVATVDNGLVKAVAAGTADITVTTTDGGKTATCKVTVTAPAPDAVTATWAFDVDHMASYSPTFTGIAEPNSSDGSYLGEPDAAAGDGGKFIESIEKNAKITFVNIDKTELDVNGKCINNVGKTGEPYVSGVWPGDYWLFTLAADAECPAGSKISLSSSFRASGTGIKFWIVEVLDGEEWVPAFETKTGSDGVDEITYNIELMNTTALPVEFEYTTKNAMKEAKVRFRAVSLACANGSARLDAPNGGTIRFKGADASPRMSFGK